MTDPVPKIAFDVTLMRPGCVLLQAAFGVNPGDDFALLHRGLRWRNDFLGKAVRDHARKNR